MDCSFILCFVLEVERLWSKAKYVLTDNRESRKWQLFEVAMHLKADERLLDSQLVSGAIHGASFVQKELRHAFSNT